MRFRRSPEGPDDDASPQGNAVDYFRLAGMRLYQPDEVLAVRLPQGSGQLAAYCKTLAWVGSEYFGRLGRDFGSMGVLIVAGIKPGRRIRLWCEAVDGTIPADVWEPFVGLLEGAGSNVWPEATAPVACALECLVGDGPATAFPMMPLTWQQAAAAGGTEGVSVPDGMFQLVFPD